MKSVREEGLYWVRVPSPSGDGFNWQVFYFGRGWAPLANEPKTGWWMVPGGMFFPDGTFRFDAGPKITINPSDPNHG